MASNIQKQKEKEENSTPRAFAKRDRRESDGDVGVTTTGDADGAFDDAENFECVEREISYSVNLSQDLLYIILSSYISQKFELAQEYIDFVDANNVRTRLANGRFESTLKTTQSLRKLVYVYKNALVPLVERVSVEKNVKSCRVSTDLRRIVTCCVYRSSECPEIEVKFEKIYLDRSAGNKFDSLMASKQITLLNLLRGKNDSVVKDSHLGSDEILAQLRLEYEYEDKTQPDDVTLQHMARIVSDMDAFSHAQNVSPFLSYTVLQNNIIYRKFEKEIMLNNADQLTRACASSLAWAWKLDGVRGKGLFTRNRIVVFMDDMRLYSCSFPWLFSVNNAVAFQCELVEMPGSDNENKHKLLFITDILQVFKYTYNNKTQYECSTDGYDVDPLSAINCINYLRQHFKNHEASLMLSVSSASLLSSQSSSLLSWSSSSSTTTPLRFQHFYNTPLRADGYSTLPTDGFVVLNSEARYIKCKHHKTIELEWRSASNHFYSLEGPLLNYQIEFADNAKNIKLMNEKIYETIVINCDTNNSRDNDTDDNDTDDNDNNVVKSSIVRVIKLRLDRLVPQSIDM
ncbi:lef4 [Lambdina fiscellaria nucleopolyhedrovirus]|uniref:Lef4 n=1 Tax=Lambdina fiscellaria nucleopolyhedrovirus TaxID=1642929 RepID=A0A0E3Z622_9ABAC|nr:lef4 [Lambdina fiscellaria nucleopolyhedrovirus]AKC91687.1 lef4 [Lambdina fiscellaria nucleopolyhedrovirus]